MPRFAAVSHERHGRKKCLRFDAVSECYMLAAVKRW